MELLGTSTYYLRKAFKVFALFVLSVLLVYLSLSVPHVIRSPEQKLLSGYPIPFYIVGVFPGCGPKSINDYPYQITTGNPWENSGTKFLSSNFRIDIAIVSIILFVIWIIKFKKHPVLLNYRKVPKAYPLLKVISLFAMSVVITLLTVFIPKFAFSNYDYVTNGFAVGFPDPFLEPKVPAFISHYPYRLPYSYIFNGVKFFNAVYFRGDVIIIFIVILLFWYAYSKD